MSVARAPDQLSQFCAAEYPRLLGALSLYCGDRDVAEDVAQETLVRVCQHWARVREMSSPGAWAYRVALNVAHSHFRRLRTGTRALVRHGVDEISVDCDPAETIATRQAVARLPKRQRQALVLRFYLDLTIDDTAQTMGTTSASVRSLTHRAVAALRRELGADSDFPEEPADVY